MLDAPTNSYLDLYGMIKDVDMHWKKVPGGKKWFILKLNPVFIKMFNCGNLYERF